MMKAELAVGDVVQYQNGLYVIIAMTDFTSNNAGCSGYDYGIDYILCEHAMLDKFDGGVMTKSDIGECTITVNLSSATDKRLIKMEDVPPYEVLPIEAYSVRKKTPKTIVVYV